MSTAPTADSAQRVVILSTVGTVVLTFIGNATAKDKNGNYKVDPGQNEDWAAKIAPAKVILGGLVAGILLSGIAQVDPPIGQGLAALMLVTSMFVVGGPAWDAISQVTGGTPSGEATPAEIAAAQKAAGPALPLQQQSRPISGAF